jgi:hypothetical protein
MKGLRSALAVAAALCAAIVTSAFGAIGGTTHKVSGVSDFQGVACPPSGACIAVGETPRNKQNFSSGAFAEISGGKPGSAKSVAGTNLLSRVACPKANFCIAVGYTFSGSSQHAVYVTIDHGKAGKVQDLGISGAASIGCGTSSSCWVPGEDFPQHGGTPTPMLVHLVDGKVAKVYTLSGSYSFAAGESGGPTPFCSSATSCIMAGTSGFTSSATGLIFSMDKGKVKIEHTVSGTSAISALDCTSSSYCTLVGYKNTGSTPQGEVTTLSSGKLGTLESVKFGLFPLACRAASACYSFGGVFTKTSSQEYIVPIDRGKPGNPQKIDTFVSAATCKGKLCLGVGNQGQFPKGIGTVFAFQG